MKCSHCGTKNPRKYKYCKECGEALGQAAASGYASPAQTVIIHEIDRKGAPTWVKILVPVVILTLLCGLLVWMDIIELGYPLVVRLPSWLYDIIVPIYDSIFS